MRSRLPHALALLLLSALPAVAAAQPRVAPPVDLSVTRCEYCAEWNEPQRPFKVFGNTYYVGTRGLAAILITSPAGHVLIDGALPESAPLIAAGVRALGFKLEDVKVLLNTHAHYDHAGGLAALQKASGAQVLLHPWSARVLRIGTSLEDDPQFGLYLPFPGVRADRELTDGEVIRVGDLAVTAHFTGGHTPGGTSFAWRACEGERCWDILLADSQSPIGDDDFRFSQNTRYPTVLQDFAHARTRFETLPCDVLLTPHPGVSGTFERLDKRAAGDSAAFRDPAACRAYAAASRQRLEARLQQEAAQRPR
jgi:metallo-beta-lactamase class B